jgi:hypothetical protein
MRRRSSPQEARRGSVEHQLPPERSQLSAAGDCLATWLKRTRRVIRYRSIAEPSPPSKSPPRPKKWRGLFVYRVMRITVSKLKNPPSTRSIPYRELPCSRRACSIFMLSERSVGRGGGIRRGAATCSSTAVKRRYNSSSGALNKRKGPPLRLLCGVRQTPCFDHSS